MSTQEYKHLFDLIDEELSKTAKKRERLRNLDLFVLDNSLRESTVGQLRGHTLDNKWGILEEVKRCGFKHIIVSAFSHAPRVDDEFVKLLCERETDMSCYHAFSELYGLKRGDDELPVGLEKMAKYKIPNPILEVDLVGCNDNEDYERFCKHLKRAIDFTFENLSRDAKILVNIRDLAPAMIKHPANVFDVVKLLGTMPPDKHLFGIMFEEPTGKYLPEQLGAFTRSVRQLMDDCNWQSGHLLVHIHKKWEYAEVVQLECLGCGADGIWASVCEEGAALGHACSLTTIMNLIRFGNKKVLEKYNCHELRHAAINVTKITTGNPPHPKQTIYGERALDVVFDTTSGMGAADGDEGTDSADAIVHELDLAKFFGCKAPIRMSTLATPAMVQERLVDLFGKHEDFTIEIAEKMKALMIEDLDRELKQEYMSSIGIAFLYRRAGGTLQPDMIESIENVEQYAHIHQALVKEVKYIWDQWDICEDAEKDDSLGYHAFYNGFMSPYFGCYQCEDSKKALQVIDLHKDGKVEWVDFRTILEWALNEFPGIDTHEDLLSAAFQKGIIPAMQSEIAKKNR